MTPVVGICDYGVGNLRSVERALCVSAAKVVISDDAERLHAATGWCFLASGFGMAAPALADKGLGDAIWAIAASGNRCSASASAINSCSSAVTRMREPTGSRCSWCGDPHEARERIQGAPYGLEHAHHRGYRFDVDGRNQHRVVHVFCALVRSRALAR